MPNADMPPIAAWQVALLRVTAFPTEVLRAEQAASWWEEIVGLPPESVIARPKGGEHQSQGEFEGRRLTLQLQPGRLEWRLEPVAKDDVPEIALLGPFPDVLTSLTKIATSWLPKAPNINRLAFGAILIQPVESVRAGYILTQKYLPAVKLDPDGSSDFLYQINRRRSTRTQVEQLQINRLMKWSVQVARLVSVTFGGDGIAARTTAEEPAGRLELDINTIPNFGPVLPREHVAGILQELMEFGREIAEKGDQP